MSWKRATFEERGKRFTDHVSPDGRWKVAEGYDNVAASDGFPWSLFERQKGEWRFVRQFAEIAHAKKYAEKQA